MNSKDFVDKVSQKAGIGADEAEKLLSALVSCMLDELSDGNSISMQGFGSFEVREKSGRKIYNPSSKAYIDVPSKTTVAYKMSGVLKERLNGV